MYIIISNTVFSYKWLNIIISKFDQTKNEESFSASLLDPDLPLENHCYKKKKKTVDTDVVFHLHFRSHIEQMWTVNVVTKALDFMAYWYYCCGESTKDLNLDDYGCQYRTYVVMFINSVLCRPIGCVLDLNDVIISVGGDVSIQMYGICVEFGQCLMEISYNWIHIAAILGANLFENPFFSHSHMFCKIVTTFRLRTHWTRWLFLPYVKEQCLHIY